LVNLNPRFPTCKILLKCWAAGCLWSECANNLDYKTCYTHSGVTRFLSMNPQSSQRSLTKTTYNINAAKCLGVIIHSIPRPILKRHILKYRCRGSNHWPLAQKAVGP
jgi:hypothetical protein